MSKRSPDKHINLNVRGMGRSATLAINERSAALKAQGRHIYKLGLGQSPFPVPQPVVEELKNSAHEKDYLDVKGLLALREEVVQYYEARQYVSRGPEDVLIGPGSKELMFILQLVFYGDLVVPTPAWVSYAPQARIIGRKVRFIHTSAESDWLLTADGLAALCKDDPDRPRIVVLNYPSNPTGNTYKSSELKHLAKVARQYRVVLLSDEIYGELHHKGQHVSIARYYPEGTIISGGISKWCGAGGWRLGTFVAPPGLRWLLEAMAAVASETFTSTSAPIQYAAVRAFEGGMWMERYLWFSRKILSSLGRWCARRLAKAGVLCRMPLGGFYLFPDFTNLAPQLAKKGITTSPGLCDALLEQTGVAILPGSDFGRSEQELTVRLAYVDFDGAHALAGMEQLSDGASPDFGFLDEYCGNVVTAVERICQWVHD